MIFEIGDEVSVPAGLLVVIFLCINLLYLWWSYESAFLHLNNGCKRYEKKKKKNDRVPIWQNIRISCSQSPSLSELEGIEFFKSLR